MQRIINSLFLCVVCGNIILREKNRFVPQDLKHK